MIDQDATRQHKKKKTIGIRKKGFWFDWQNCLSINGKSKRGFFFRYLSKQLSSKVNNHSNRPGNKLPTNYKLVRMKWFYSKEKQAQQSTQSKFCFSSPFPGHQLPCHSIFWPLDMWIWRTTLWFKPSFQSVFHFVVSGDMKHVPVNWNLRCQISQCA